MDSSIFIISLKIVVQFFRREGGGCLLLIKAVFILLCTFLFWLTVYGFLCRCPYGYWCCLGRICHMHASTGIRTILGLTKNGTSLIIPWNAENRDLDRVPWYSWLINTFWLNITFYNIYFYTFPLKFFKHTAFSRSRLLLPFVVLINVILI